jgi:hypothetical protein
MRVLTLLDILSTTLSTPATLVASKESLFSTTNQVDGYEIPFLRQAVQEGKINLKYVDTKDQLADIFTKMLPFPQFRKLRTEIGGGHYQFE